MERAGTQEKTAAGRQKLSNNMKKKKTNIHSLIDKLAAEEDQFLQSEFLSPVLKGRAVRVRISGIVMEMRVVPVNFQGWGVFKPTTRRLAKHVRAPSMMERRQYLALFPTMKFILHHQNKDLWYGTLAQADARFNISGSVPIYLSEEVQLFDTVCARFDGQICWFDEVDPRKSPKSGAYLREMLTTLAKPEKLDLDIVSKQELDAYQIAYKVAYEASEEAKMAQAGNRIKVALERAGADYKSHIERGDSFTIEYQIDGNPHRSVVDKKTLSVISAGICLSGYDRNFDLQSLVGVIREGHRRDHIVDTSGRDTWYWNQYGHNRGNEPEHDYDDDDDD